MFLFLFHSDALHESINIKGRGTENGRESFPGRLTWKSYSKPGLAYIMVFWVLVERKFNKFIFCLE